MKFVCDACGARYKIDDSRLKPGRALRIRCKRCTHVIELKPPEAAVGDTLPHRRATGRLTAFRKADTAAAPATELPKVWHFARNGETFGPYAEQELVSRFERGDIGDEVYLWKAGFDGWKPAAELPTFAEAIRKAVAAKARSGPSTQRLSAADVKAALAPEAEDDAEEKTRVHNLADLKAGIDSTLEARRTSAERKRRAEVEQKQREQAARAEAEQERRAEAERKQREQAARAEAERAREIERQALEAEERAREAARREAEEAARARAEAEAEAAERDQRARQAATERREADKQRRMKDLLKAPRPATRSSLPAVGKPLPKPGPPLPTRPATPTIPKDRPESSADEEGALETRDDDSPTREPPTPTPTVEDTAEAGAPLPPEETSGETSEEPPEETSGETREEPPEETSGETSEEALDDFDAAGTPPRGTDLGTHDEGSEDAAATPAATGARPQVRTTGAIRAEALLADFEELDADDPSAGIEMWPDADEVPPPPPPPPRRRRTLVWVGAGTVAVAFLLMLLIPQRGDGPRTASDEEGTLSVETAQDRQRRLQNVEAATRRAERTIHTAWTRADGRVTAEVARREAAARQRTRPGTPGAGTAEPTGERRSLADQIRAAGDGSADSGSTVRRDGIGRAPLPTGDRLGSLSGTGTSGLSTGSLSGAGADGPTRTGLSSTASRGPSADHFRPGFDRFVSPAINRCNQRHMGEVGELLTGRVVLQFRIEPDGRVTRLTTSGPASNTPFFRCMTSESSRWRFEPFQGETATIERTYVLR